MCDARDLALLPGLNFLLPLLHQSGCRVE